MRLLFESSFYIWFDLKNTNLNIDEQADVIADIMQKIKSKINADFPLINMDCYAKSDFKGEFYHQLELKKQGRSDDTYDAKYSAFMIDLDKSLRIVLNELFVSPESELYRAIANVDNLKIDILYRDVEMALKYFGDGKFNIRSENGLISTTMTFNQLAFNLENFESILLGDEADFEEMCAEAEKRKLETA